MYDNEAYPVRYPADVYYDYNQAPSHNYYDVYRDDHYGMPPEHYKPYPPMPCPEYPPVQPAPPTMPDMRMQCLMQLRDLLEQLMDKKVSFVIEGAKGKFDCTKIVSVNDCVVVVDTKNGICVIPLDEITAICMSKDVAKDVIGYKD